MNTFNKLFIIIIYTVWPLLVQGTIGEKFQIQRPDGSTLVGYITLPENSYSYPIAFLTHGAQLESVWVWHEDFYKVATNFGAAFVTLEKQGVYSPTEFDLVEYNLTNSLDNRVEDHILFVEKLRAKDILPNWNGNIIVIGGSEGARVAIMLSSKIPEIKAVGLYTCGGGLSTVDEFKLTFKKFLTSQRESPSEITEMMNLLDDKINEIIANPTTDQHFMTSTYKWWASHFTHNFLEELLQINHPIFYVHGTDDQVIPIESADKVAESFEKNKKNNLIYVRLQNYDHDMRLFPHFVLKRMFEMLESQRPILFPGYL